MIAIAVGLVVRLLMKWFVVVRITADAAAYNLMGTNIARHGIFSLSELPPIEPTVYRPPAYPALIGAVYKLAGEHLLAVQLAQIALSLTVIVALSRALSKREPRWGAVFMIAAVLCPFDAVYSVVMLSECLAATFVVGAIAVMLNASRTREWVLSGFLLGLATLTRDIYVALVPFVMAGWWLTGDGGRRERLKHVAAMALCAACTVLPWTARNYTVAHRLVPVSAGRLGFSLWVGAWAIDDSFTRNDALGERVYPSEAYSDRSEQLAFERALLARDNSTQDRLAKEMFRARLRREPIRVIGRWFVRAPRLWTGTRFELFELNPSHFARGSLSWKLAKSALWGLNLLVVLLGTIGAVRLFKRDARSRLLSAPLLFSVLVYFPLNSFESRYSQPVYLLLLALAVHTALVMYDWLVARRQAMSAQNPSVQA
jgi:hypothetical protein